MTREKEIMNSKSSALPKALTLATETLKLEREINDAVNQAYGLTHEEIYIMRKTAPPRMPIQKR